MLNHNILFIMTDQFRWDAMGCCGCGIKTPNLDYIASQGIRFTNCVTNSPVCVPARVSLALGQYPHNTNIWQNMDYTMPIECNTWTRSIKSAGYHSCVIGKTHLHPHSGDLREKEYLLHAYGFDDVNEIGGPRANAGVLSHMTAEWKSRACGKHIKRITNNGLYPSRLWRGLLHSRLNNRRTQGFYTFRDSRRGLLYGCILENDAQLRRRPIYAL